MEGNYQRCYAVGHTARHREGRGKLFRIPRISVRYVRKIVEQIYDKMTICMEKVIRIQVMECPKILELLARR